MSIGEKIYFFIKIKKVLFIEWIKVIFKFYLNIKFLAFETIFFLMYFFINPYRASRKYLEKINSKSIYDYGETFLTEFSKIIKKLDISSNTKVLELGSGRGRLSFWLHFFYKCSIVSIERIPIFVKISNLLIKIFKIKKLKFIAQDFFNLDMSHFDIIYLYGTTLSDHEIHLLIKKFKKVSPNAKIITISYSLKDFDENFKTLQSFNIKFPWGETTAFFNVLKEN